MNGRRDQPTQRTTRQQTGGYPQQQTGRNPNPGQQTAPTQPTGQYARQRVRQYPPQGQPSGQYPPQNQPSGAYSSQHAQPYRGVGQPSAPYQPQQPSGPVERKQPQPEPGRRRKELKQNKRGFWSNPESSGRALVSLLIFVVIVLILMYAVVYRVRYITVTGNTLVSDDTIASLAGVHTGQSTLFIDQTRIADAVNSNRYLIYDSTNVTWNSVTINVIERTADAVLKNNGYYYTIDRSGMVLEQTSDAASAPSLVEVSGLNVSGRNGIRLGSRISVSDDTQLAAMSEILLYLRVFSMEEIVTSIKLSDMDNILLETVEGDSVAFGSSTRVRAKLKALKYVRENLLERDAGRGTIDITVPESPTFIPES